MSTEDFVWKQKYTLLLAEIFLKLSNLYNILPKKKQLRYDRARLARECRQAEYDIDTAVVISFVFFRWGSEEVIAIEDDIS